MSKKSRNLSQVLSCFFVAIPCQSSETQIWVPLTHKGRNTEVHGCAGKEQAVYPTAPQMLHQHLSVFFGGGIPTSKMIQRRVKGQRQIFEDALPFGPGEGVSQQCEERQRRAGYVFPPNFIYLYFMYFAYMYVYVGVSNLGVIVSCGLPCRC